MPNIPEEHITDAQSMNLDAEIDLFDLFPTAGGIVRFKNDDEQTWLGNTYAGVPLELSGEGRTADRGFNQATLTIGQPNIDLSAFKPLIANGSLDGARIDRHTVLLDHLLDDINIKKTISYRVKRVDGYSSSLITLILATFSPAGPSTLPFRQFLPPAFPFVRLN